MFAPTLIISVSLFVVIQTANDASGNLENSLHCEKISFDFCNSMPYKRTRMPNFLRDTNQIEAAERAKQYELLVQTGCSRHLLDYLCELLAPMCLDGASNKRFEIYPCRSSCRQVRRDCNAELNKLYTRFNQPVLFHCDQLPYEANGGNETDRGPCHEIPDSGPPPTPSHNYNAPPATSSPDPSQTYGPWQPEPDRFNPEDARIDPSILRPIQATPKHMSDANKLSDDPVWLARIDATALKLAWTLLGVLIMACLLILLKIRLAASSASSRKSSSSASSSGSQRKLASNSGSGAAHKQTVSPSSSSRSLMLLAAGGHEKLQTSHLPAEGPSHKLLHQAGLGQRTTLINLNETMERHAMQQQHQEAIRYHMVQSLNGQSQLLPQHQYDYIQVGSVDNTPKHQQMQPKIADLDGFKPRRALHEAALRARKQHGTSASNSSGASKMAPGSQRGATEPGKLYSNILLSSPSHQVLLFADHQAEQRGQTFAGPPPPPSSQPPPAHFGMSQQHSSNGGYDTPLVGQEQHQRSFQRRPSFGAGQLGSLSSSGRNVARAWHHAHLLGQELAAESASQALPNSFASSASGSESAASSTSFSPPATIGKPQLQQGGPVQLTR